LAIGSADMLQPLFDEPAQQAQHAVSQVVLGRKSFRCIAETGVTGDYYVIQKIEENIMNQETPNATVIKAENSEKPVTPVAPPSLPIWPPPWLATTSPAAVTVNGTITANTFERAKGWLLPCGTVICACCFPRPAGAVSVVLGGDASNPGWIEVVQTKVVGEGAGDPTQPCPAPASSIAPASAAAAATAAADHSGPNPETAAATPSAEPQWL
jgi:hypothetical protein